MKQLYELAGLTKQAHLACVGRHTEQEDRFLLLSAVLKTERSKHPAMSLKKLYVRLKPDFAGRDAFINYCMTHGFEPAIKAKFHKTTHVGEWGVYPNLLHDLVIYDINQLWVSDITYFKVQGAWFYIVLIEDVYSRKILGWNASARMLAQANLKALEVAIQNRGIPPFSNTLIHHSDKGAQYRSLLYTDKLKEHQLRISMGNSCYDNAFMESANGILKNEYLKHRPIHNGNDLAKYLEQDVFLYNYERPHGSLNRRTPHEFERYISNIPLNQRLALPIYTDKSKQHKMLKIKPDNQQLKLKFPGFK